MLDAALAVFGEKGYDGATLDEVAERAEFGKGTLYNYFPGGKDEVYVTLFEEHVIGGLAAAIETAFPDLAEVETVAGARAAFHRLVMGLIGHFDTNRSVLLLFMREGHRMMTDPATRAHVAGRFEALIDGVARPVERAVAAGAMRLLPARPVAHLIMGNVRGYLLAHLDATCAPDARRRSDDHVGGDPAEAAAFITTVLFDGLLAAPARA